MQGTSSSDRGWEREWEEDGFGCKVRVVGREGGQRVGEGVERGEWRKRVCEAEGLERKGIGKRRPCG